MRNHSSLLRKANLRSDHSFSYNSKLINKPKKTKGLDFTTSTPILEDKDEKYRQHYQEWLESGIADDLINYLAVGGDE